MTTRVVLITGCSSGIGLETALAFARRGDRTVASMRNLAKADALMSRAAQEGLSVELVQLDVTDGESVTSAVSEVERRHGAIDVLVNNAGIGGNGPIETMDIDLARAMLEVNLWGPVRVIRAALPAMRERGSGVIINISSVSARVPAGAFHAFYGASKHGLNALSEALCGEIAPFGLRVVCIEPGFFATAIGGRTNPDSSRSGPYTAQHEWSKEYYRKSLATAKHPSIAADAIVAAADDPATPLHALIGTDATKFVELVTRLGSYEAWQPMRQQIFEGIAGPRPK